MNNLDLFDIAYDILEGIFGEEPCTEIVEEVVSYVDDAETLTEDQAIDRIKEICNFVCPN